MNSRVLLNDLKCKREIEDLSVNGKYLR
jgi:hypothetical protein